MADLIYIGPTLFDQDSGNFVFSMPSLKSRLMKWGIPNNILMIDIGTMF